MAIQAVPQFLFPFLFSIKQNLQTIGIIAYVIPAMEKTNFPSLGDFTFETGIVTCSLLIGCLIGSVFSPTFNEILGKKRVILGIGILTTVATFFTAVSFWLAMFVITRQILGIAVGVASVVCPIYVAEIAPVRMSGALGGFFQVCFFLPSSALYSPSSHRTTFLFPFYHLILGILTREISEKG